MLTMNKWIQVILLAISLFLVGLFMPYALNIPTPSLTDDIYVNTNYTCIGDCTGSGGDPIILILLAILLPIVFVIGLFMYYLPRLKDREGIEYNA